ncbi:hypothetical protein [Streptomyces sp. NPDC059761]|uniref:hypothetical protein n=1 Tax=Streptomyces sp. NPDC059761 TaxID=3346937 RepID=UPI003651E480
MNQQLTIGAVDSLVNRRPWTPPSHQDFAYSLVQAYDQALVNTGSVIIRSNSLGIHLLAAQMIRPPADVQAIKSIEGNYAKADSVLEGVTRARTGLAATVDAVVYERPPVLGQRVDSITMAGREIHRATQGRAVMIDNRHAKKVILGRAGSKNDPVTKAHVKEAVERYITPPPRGSLMPWNEHIRDAVMLALTWLYDEKQRQLRIQQARGEA